MTLVDFVGILNRKVKHGYFQTVWFPCAAYESGFQVLHEHPCSSSTLLPCHSTASRVPAGELKASRNVTPMSLGRALPSFYGN